MIYHHAYGWALYILAAAAVLVGLLGRAFAAFTNRYPADIEELNGEQSLLQKSYTYYRRWLGVPAAFGYTRAQSWYGMSLPTRLQGFWVRLSYVRSRQTHASGLCVLPYQSGLHFCDLPLVRR